MIYGRRLLLTQAKTTRTIRLEAWRTRAHAGAGVACLYVKYQKNIYYYNTKRGAFAHRCAAITVWGAFRRWRLHHNVGHITGVISALIDQLKRQEVELNGALQFWLNVDLLFGCFDFMHFFFCVCLLQSCAPGAGTLPFSGRNMDWEWLRGCRTSCWGSELWERATMSLSVTTFRVPEERARCMFFTASDRRGMHVIGRRWNKPATEGEMLIYCMQNEPNHERQLHNKWLRFKRAQAKKLTSQTSKRRSKRK